MSIRTAHGYPMRNSEARAADVVARLSGVNYGSVLKIMAAIEALYKVRGVPSKDVVSLENCPTIAAHADPAKRDQRYRHTQKELRLVMQNRHLLTDAQRQTLMLEVRFNEDGSSKLSGEPE